MKLKCSGMENLKSSLSRSETEAVATTPYQGEAVSRKRDGKLVRKTTIRGLALPKLDECRRAKRLESSVTGSEELDPRVTGECLDGAKDGTPKIPESGEEERSIVTFRVECPSLSTEDPTSSQKEKAEKSRLGGEPGVTCNHDDW